MTPLHATLFLSIFSAVLLAASGLMQESPTARRLGLTGLAFLAIALFTAGFMLVQHDPDHWNVIGQLAQLLATAGVLFGVNTINWLWPATGAATPTAAQVANQNSVTVDVTTDGALTTQTLTHNMNIPAGDIANGFPDIQIESNGPTGIPATLLIDITRPVSANAVVLTFAAVVGTFRVKIKRPHTVTM